MLRHAQHERGGLFLFTNPNHPVIPAKAGTQMRTCDPLPYSLDPRFRGGDGRGVGTQNREALCRWLSVCGNVLCFCLDPQAPGFFVSCTCLRRCDILGLSGLRAGASPLRAWGPFQAQPFDLVPSVIALPMQLAPSVWALLSREALIGERNLSRRRRWRAAPS